jgi:hypothetical protein
MPPGERSTTAAFKPALKRTNSPTSLVGRLRGCWRLSSRETNVSEALASCTFGNHYAQLYIASLPISSHSDAVLRHRCKILRYCRSGIKLYLPEWGSCPYTSGGSCHVTRQRPDDLIAARNQHRFVVSVSARREQTCEGPQAQRVITGGSGGRGGRKQLITRAPLRDHHLHLAKRSRAPSVITGGRRGRGGRKQFLGFAPISPLPPVITNRSRLSRGS